MSTRDQKPPGDGRSRPGQAAPSTPLLTSSETNITEVDPLVHTAHLGCPHGCGPDGHEDDCGLDHLLAQIEIRRADRARRDRERAQRAATVRYWTGVALGWKEVA